WDPLIRWIADRHQLSLKITDDVAHIEQDPDVLQKMATVVGAQEDMTLAPLYNITALCGSLVIGLAVLDGHITAETAFEAGEIDETHIMEQWGEDEEALTRRKNNKESLMASVRFLQLCGIVA
ncbi:MAG: ATPase, partial [Sneathiella sp.]